MVKNMYCSWKGPKRGSQYSCYEGLKIQDVLGLKVTVEISLSTAMRTRLVIKKSWDTAQWCGIFLASIKPFADKVD